MRHKNRESGYILVGVLLAVTILAVVGTSLVTLSTSSVKTSFAERDNQAVYYIAEAGLNHLVNEFEQAVEEIYEKDYVKTEEAFFEEIGLFSQNEFDDYDIFEKVNDDEPKAQLDIEEIDDETGLYKMTSTGSIGDEEREVTQEVRVKWQDKYKGVEGGEYELPPFAVFTSGQFTMSNGEINGDIGTLNKQNNAIDFPSGGPTLNGDIYVPDGNAEYVNENANKGNSEIKVLNESYKIPQLPTFPAIPELQCPKDETINYQNGSHKIINNCNFDYTNWDFHNSSNYKLELDEDMKFRMFKTANNISLTIDVKDSDKIMVVDNFEVGGDIDLIGTGSLTIYITNRFTLGSSKINEGADVERLNVYYKGNEAIKLAGSQKVYGSLYAEKADIELTAGGGFIGNIFTGGKSFKIDGGSYNQAQLFFAPNAYFDMTSGGTEFEGMIIAERFEISGGWEVFFQELNFSNGPISPSALGGGDNNNGGSGGTGGSGDSELIETGAKPSISKKKIREVVN